jgi:hypothetical protein
MYIVTLKNRAPISVNAQDPRMADRCIKVTCVNCKVGKAKSFAARERNYFKTFGEDNVVFRPIAFATDLVAAERAVLAALSRWRILSGAKRKTEWLVGIAPSDAEARALEALRNAGIAFTLPAIYAR